MKIVVLDGYALNPGDLNWEGFESLGDVTVYDRSSAEEVVERSKGADALITNKALVSKEIIDSIENLKYIGVLATGVNIVDLNAAAARNIPVCNIAGYGPYSVAQMVFAHILNHTHHLAEHVADVQAGGWTKCPDFCYWLYPLVELKDLTLGIVGLGMIGQASARIAHGFGMEVIAYDQYQSPQAPEFVTWKSLEEVFAESDFVTLHCPLTDETEKLVNEERIRLMKPTAFLVNTARGPLVDEAALATALNEGRIAGAGVDVLFEEPPSMDNPLIGANNCSVTPHISWATRSARSRLMGMAVNNMKAFLAGSVTNCVNL
ncbi:MAG: D-2-hydroxyacid dehydrogenase [Verrucomicrobia bacterium]|nr:D-2-hydroxyacid dehydrogenase [Verrucomicrobiota bacterium]